MRQEALAHEMLRQQTLGRVADVDLGTARRTVRYVAAATAFAAGIMYLLIAVGILTVIDPGVAAEQAPVFIPIAAAAAFILGTILLLAFDRRVVYVLGAAVQVLTLVGYFAIAPERTPSYEIWGILIKVAQVLTLVALVYLATRPKRPARSVL